mmetsp:Transcript_3301/g.7385  ORF Transcript_3301/g.7385 Transcript_3301/m.7385 type:complete len:88 (-) Transcript_3301:296-559(-)
MLSEAGEFDGGQLQTVEAGGAVRAHALGCGDALIFLSHKQHFVAPVEAGRRHVLIIELWEGEERTCQHRCSIGHGPPCPAGRHVPAV